MTKQELLAQAKILNIVGRHEMTKAQLEAAIADYEEVEVQDEAFIEEMADEVDQDDEAAEEDNEAEEVDMSSDEAAVKELEKLAETMQVSKAAVKEVVRRYPSLQPRDNTGRVIRQGRNLSRNSPFKYKFYYLNPAVADEAKWTPEYREAVEASPLQLQGLLRCMAAHFTDRTQPALGSYIAECAKDRGFVTSKISGDKLFAYYRKALEVLGVIHLKGYDPEAQEIED